MTSCGATVLPMDLGHLHALLVQREAVGQNAPVGRAPDGAAGLQHRGMEPPPVLVGAPRGRGPRCRPRTRPRGRGRTKAWVEPLSNQTSRMSKDLFPRLGVVLVPEEARLGAGLVPRIRARRPRRASRMRALTAGSRQQEIGVCRCRPFLDENRSNGTPHARWRDRTQSGRASIML